LEPAQLKALTHKIWLAQYRLNDLLAQVHAEKWKMPPSARTSFDQSLESLRNPWRQRRIGAQFDARPTVCIWDSDLHGDGSGIARVDGVAGASPV